MINILVRVPAMGRSYQFNAEENSTIDTVIEEMAGMICRKEQCEMEKEGHLYLCSVEKGDVLPGDSTFFSCGIQSADTLILI